MDYLNSFIAYRDQRTEVAKKWLAEMQEYISAEVALKGLLERFTTKSRTLDMRCMFSAQESGTVELTGLLVAAINMSTE
ncbi:hypothetical protein NDU88_004231 [Pleurodeles waltl]|uniref:Uncharacterized protein n=1 Tax=Pleurodeles waltl TaxID=8319 RepID=A0AAV7RIR6_PLEWA|nr:hypothetical protein NDU88_004231 [Pleurodeles waltl]